MHGLVAIALLLAGCAPTLAGADRKVRADRDDAASALMRATERARADLGTALIEPVVESRPMDRGAGMPAGVMLHRREPSVSLLVEPGPDGAPRVAHVVPSPDQCGASRPVASFVYGRGPGGRVRLIVIDPVIHVDTIHLDGSCGMPGCGAEPPPPPLVLRWLPTSDPDAIDVERRAVPVTVTDVTCDHPQYPP